MANTHDLLTDDEHQAMQLTADLWNLLNRIVGQGRSRTGDLAEICHNVHAIQHVILAQAAARAYPDQYRLLGGPPVWTSDTPSPSKAPACRPDCDEIPGYCTSGSGCLGAAPSTSETQP